MARTVFDYAGHDIIRIVWTRPVPGRAGVGLAAPAATTDAVVEAYTVVAPVVGAATADGGEGGCRGEEESEACEEEFHCGIWVWG